MGVSSGFEVAVMTISNLTWRWPWLIVGLLLTLIILAGLTLWLVRRRLRGPKQTWPASRSKRSRSGAQSAVVFTLNDDIHTESAAKTYRLWRRLNRLGAFLLAAALIVASLLAARPASVDQSLESGRTRDIVLCLDVSGSTLPYDRQVLTSYLDLVSNFKGERIGLSIFNSTSRTVFPLTDDYHLVTRQLKEANNILKGVQSQQDIDRMSDKQYQAVADWLEGTQNRKDTTSLIGDGLVSCAAMLPAFSTQAAANSPATQQRQASIVLATDNVTSGRPTYTLEEALALTKQAGISVDGLYSGPQQSQQDDTTKQMRQLIEGQGGIFLLQDGSDSINSLVRQVEQRHAGADRGHQRSSLVDTPGWWALALCLLVGGYLLVVWRLKR
ncbi:VWA domain-containing protein [Bombiscardovia nodaiensis]|uniref:VWA domain-containing protein n=1 Tax=Bombiscardovia nodaiensis TaxID=2932181 RepID=A0ABM8B7A0_9BIFI|nr:VWA domain-containing protein [Bombiscardovia nodaiensis]